MFGAPPTIQATTIAILPERFHVAGRVSGRYESRPFYIEGPSLSRDGTLYFTDIPGGRIFSLAPGGDVELFIEYDGEPNGTKIHRDGRIFVADNKRGIVAIDPETKQIETIVDRVANERLRGPNDLTFALNGDIYFTDQGNSDILRSHGRVIRVTSEGETAILLENIPSPNGLVLSPDEKFLYVAVTRTNAIWKSPLTVPPGLIPTVPVGTTGTFIQMSGGTGPDGMAVDQDGNIVIAHTGLGCAWLFSPIGEPLLRINTSAGLSVSNVVYGGPENRTLFITESSTGAIMTAEMPVPGHLLFSHTA
ncbi:SMP-30/gluconolactonase/LRE family protein [Lysinimonas soli]|uniref:SMP-30/gluconolactonase/LRE family protein n=1 Tax=Lysinimonas soli TaxID=1074233 RepID=A0ABW0NTK0_9MICO